MNTLLVLKYGLSLTFSGYRQLWFLRQWLRPIIESQSQTFAYNLSEKEKKKVLFYYPMYTVLACAEMYLSIKGRKLTLDERKRLSLVGAMATVCDDLIDEDHWTREQIFQLLSAEINQKGLSARAYFLLGLNNELKKFWTPHERYIKQLKIALEWQSNSEQQSNQAISLEEIINLCRKKNGNTSLMFATLLDEHWTQNELDFIYQSAMVGQLINDSFDMYFDTQNDLYTVINKSESMEKVRDLFINECRILHQKVRSCGENKQLQESTIRRMCILHAFALTAIDQLTATEKRHGAPVDWKNIPRNEVVIDMAKNSNRFKTVRYMKWLAKQ